MTDTTLIDAQDRARALDTACSYIVQAPAGSGKTGLLIQRFLALLARVEQPEEVVAITFTRKAAAEMRVRVMGALKEAGQAAPTEAYQRQTWTLARAALLRDEAMDWNLNYHPSRLRIMTIDSLCASLVQQMPVLSRFGATPQTNDRPHVLYQRAARRVLDALETKGVDNDALHTVLQHLDNDHGRVERLLISMLASRDRWLGLVAGGARPQLERAALEEALTGCVEHAFAAVAAAVPDGLVDELIDVTAYAAAQCPADSPLRACAAIDAIPGSDAAMRPLWEGIAHLVLTDDANVRKRLTVREGFPAPSSAANPADKNTRREFKERAQALLGALAESPGLLSALAAIRHLPPVAYEPLDWRMLQALRRLLPLAAAQLKLVFQERGEVDFTERTHRALAALGTDEAPTDLALQLDYRISHLLIDEFQDTSRTQFELVEKLVAGWTPEDGRTLFLVGDPMQSIYRFREADVGLFLHARAHGVAGVELDGLRLQANFRSRPELVDEHNALFGQIFPARESIEESAVTFVPATAQRPPAAAEAGLFVHAYTDESGLYEAEQVAQCVAAARARDAQASIAILVRNRSHLLHILPTLNRHGLRYGALDIKKLQDAPVVSDLWALTRALLHLGDRTAWLSVLRAPWCGLTLQDLYALGAEHPKLSVWETIINEARRAPLSDDGKLRLNRIKSVLAKALVEKGRRDLRRWVEGVWTALGGPASVTSDADLEDAFTYFDLLEAFEERGGFDNLHELAQAVEGLFANHVHDRDEPLQIMTLHRAKGLEFDIVIVPALHRTGAPNERPLLQYLEQIDARGRPRMILAPIHATGADDPIGRYIARIEERRERHEALRLLYVAATRAREALHLFTRVAIGPDGDAHTPRRRSLAELMWPALGERFVAQLTTQDESVEQERTADPASRFVLRRVPSKWMLPQAPQPKPWRGADATLTHSQERRGDWAGDTARHVGTTVHRVLQQVANEGMDNWIGRWSDSLPQYLKRMLANLGVAPDEVDAASVRAQRAIENCLTDERGRWILQRHAAGRTEMPVSGWLEGRLHNIVLDRTFVDAERVRWIIDYKTATHEGGTVDTFIDNQFEMYRPQLELYARIMQRYDPTPIKLGLYFPLVQGWREWILK